jgi:hypothetical protein
VVGVRGDKELIDMEPQQQPGTFGMSQRPQKKVKTISWDQGVLIPLDLFYLNSEAPPKEDFLTCLYYQ